MKNRWLWIVAALLGAGVLMGQVVAQDEDDGCGCAEEACGEGCDEGCDEGCGEGCGEGGGEAGMGMMPEWMKLTAEHAGFKKMVGEWTAAWDFGAMGGKGVGSNSAKLVFGGRFVEQTFKGNMMGIDFEGRGLMGWDTVGKQYISTWIDSMSPYLYVMRGKETNGVVELVGEEPDMSGGGMIGSIIRIQWQNDNQYTLSFFKKKDGKEAAAGKIVYTRK